MAILVLDAVDGLTAQDAHVAGYVVEEGKRPRHRHQQVGPARAEKTDRTFDEYVNWIRREVPFLDFAPVVSISAKTGQRVGRVLEAAVDVWGERRKRISTGELNRLARRGDPAPGQPPVVKGKRPKIFYATQAAVAPPTFVVFAREAGSVHFSYRRYLENQLREAYGFDGTPIRLVFRERSSVELPRRRRAGGAGAKAGTQGRGHGRPQGRTGATKGSRRG